MRTLLVNPAASDTFWSFPEVCRLLGKKAPAIPLGLVTVAAMLPSGWPLRLVDLAIRDITEADWRWAETVMLSGMIAQRPGMMKVIAKARQHGKLVVVGGPCASSLPLDILEAGADIVMRGEAENQMTALLAAIDGRDRGMIIETDEKPLLATSPVPRFDLLDRSAYLNPMVQTSRGCPFACEFCDVTRVFGRHMRHKEPSQVLAELESLRRLGWRGHIFVADDNFIGNRPKTLSLLAALTEWQYRYGEPFSFGTQASVNLGRDPDMIDRMTAANFGEVFIGIESPDRKALQMACKHQNLEGSITRSIETIRDNGLLITGSVIIGMDNEQKGVGKRICALVERTNIPAAMINLMGAPPETRLWHRLDKEGRLTELLDGYLDAAGLRMNFVPARPIEDIQREYKETWEHLYDRKRYLKRCFNYFRAMRPTRKALARKTGDHTDVSMPAADPGARAKRLSEATVAIRIFFDHGIRHTTRFQFWRQFFILLHRNPSRLYWYLSTYQRIDDMQRIRGMVIRAWRKNSPAIRGSL